MAANTLTLGLPRSSMDNLTIEDHIKSMLDKLENMRQAKVEARSISGKNYRQPMKIEIRTLEFWRSIISECLASFFFVFIVSGAGLLKNYDSTVVVTTALAAGFSMAMLNFCFGHISGEFDSNDDLVCLGPSQTPKQEIFLRKYKINL